MRHELRVSSGADWETWWLGEIIEMSVSEPRWQSIPRKDGPPLQGDMLEAGIATLRLRGGAYGIEHLRKRLGVPTEGAAYKSYDKLLIERDGVTYVFSGGWFYAPVMARGSQFDELAITIAFTQVERRET